jgi:hypothetical protein
LKHSYYCNVFNLNQDSASEITRVPFERFSPLFHRPFESPLSTYLTDLNVSANIPRDSQPPIDSVPARCDWPACTSGAGNHPSLSTTHYLSLLSRCGPVAFPRETPSISFLSIPLRGSFFHNEGGYTHPPQSVSLSCKLVPPSFPHLATRLPRAYSARGHSPLVYPERFQREATNSCICHTSRKRARNSFPCHTSENTGT